MWLLPLTCVLLAFMNVDGASNVDTEGVKQAVPNVGQSSPPFDGEYPSKEQILEMLDSMGGLSQEDKERLKDDLLKQIHAQASNEEDIVTSNTAMQTIILLSLLALVALIFAFFTYKLFKCLKEREQKRQEKKKNKELKKKK